MGNLFAWLAHEENWQEENQEEEREQYQSSLQTQESLTSEMREEEETNGEQEQSITSTMATSKRKRDNDDDDDGDKVTSMRMRSYRNKRKQQQMLTNVNNMTSSTISTKTTLEDTIAAEDVETMKSTFYTPCSVIMTTPEKEKNRVFSASDDNKVSEKCRKRFNTLSNETQPLCQCVCFGDGVEKTYGCHYHLYETISPTESHGVALGWSLRRQSLRLHSLLTLGRVANSCRKKVVLVGNAQDTVVLQYTAEL